MNNRISIRHFSNHYNDQLRALEFYKQEIGILKERLTEVAGKNTSRDALPMIEHYENEFKIQINNIDELSHSIRANISEVGQQARVQPAGYVSDLLFRDHKLLSDRIVVEEYTINELRHSFMRFAANWM